MKRFKKFLKYSLISQGVTVGTVLLVATFYLVFFFAPKNEVSMDNFSVRKTTVLYYRDGEELVEQARISSGGDSTWISFQEMPEYAKKAAVAIEDQRFYEHSGVDWLRTGKAVLNLATGKSGGGSTITQQLVKNMTGESSYSLKRKLKEIFGALSLERHNSKDEILECYLNTIYLANGCRGIETGAQFYFGKSAKELTLGECATLIGITKSPEYYNPVKNIENATERRNTILWKMWELGILDEQTYRDEIAVPITLCLSEQRISVNNTYSYFTDTVYRQVIEDLVKIKGYDESYARFLLANGGLTIITTQDENLQNIVDSVFENENSFSKTDTVALPQGAITIVENKTGKVLAVYGGRGEKTASLSLNRAVDSYRQPGSVIKPLSVYAPALELGLITEASVFDDIPLDVENGWPRNYDSNYNGYRGLTCLQTAVADSTNTVAVQVLRKVGYRTSYDYLQNTFGFAKMTERDMSDSPLAMGALTNGTNTTELASAYATFASSGIYSKPYFYEKVIDGNGQVLLENKPKQSQAVSPETAYLTTDLLMGVIEEGTGHAATLPQVEVAGKTGTTSDNKDRWFVGYTPEYSCAVWFGYDTPQEIVVEGTNPALKLWKAVMKQVSYENTAFDRPGTIIECAFCTDGGGTCGILCHNDLRGDRSRVGRFVKGTEPTARCTTHRLVAICTESGQIAGENCPSECIHYVPLLSVWRELSKDILIRDAQYTYWSLPFDYRMPESGAVYRNLLKDGCFCGHSDTDHPVNGLCSLHRTIGE